MNMDNQIREVLILQLQDEVIFLQNRLNEVSEKYEFIIKGDGSLTRRI